MYATAIGEQSCV